MIKNLIVIGLLASFFGLPAAAGDPDDDDVFYKFLRYTQDVYLSQAGAVFNETDFTIAFGGTVMSSRILGYSLGNLLQFARRGSANHKIWLMLESKTKEAIFAEIEREAELTEWDRAYIENRKQKAWQQCLAAQQGWLDNVMAAWTTVPAKSAPNFFETLAAVPPPPPPPPPDPVPIVPAVPPDPPPSSDDAVAGVYKVIGKSWENDPRCGSLVTLIGSMNEVEAEFKLWDWTGVTWHYKGSAKGDGSEGNTSLRSLKGKTQWLKYPHIIHELDVRITRSASGVWRATSINIGGNLFQLAEIQVVERPIPAAAKTLTIRNSTAGRITVYLDGVEIGLDNKLGTVEPRSETKFTGLPERGRWYLKIEAPEAYPKRHVAVLYVKEAEFAFFYEVLERHLK
jgi:hypothetical protein